MATGLFAVISLTAPLTGAHERVVPLQELAEEVDLYQFFQYGWDESLILEISAGSSIPFNGFVQGELVELRKEDAQRWMIDVKQTFYVRHFKEKGFFFSVDQKRWRPLFEFVTGEMTAGLVSDENGPLFSFKLVANVRK